MQANAIIRFKKTEISKQIEMVQKITSKTFIILLMVLFSLHQSLQLPTGNV